MKTTSCKSCGAPIIWAKTSPVKWMPIDSEPNSKGNVTLDEIHEEIIATVVGKRERFRLSKKEPGTVFYMPHWATCPSANGHRAA